jgi:hypothetical protein
VKDNIARQIGQGIGEKKCSGGEAAKFFSSSVCRNIQSHGKLRRQKSLNRITTMRGMDGALLGDII